MISQYIHAQTIDFETLGTIVSKVLNILLRWLSKGLENQGKVVRTEDRRKYKALLKDDQRMITLKAEDGWLEMTAFQLIFQNKTALKCGGGQG